MTVTIQSESPYVLSSSSAGTEGAQPQTTYPEAEDGRPTITISGANARLIDE
jgi:hypothetical protein